MIGPMDANTRPDLRAGATVTDVWTDYRRRTSVDAATLRSYESLFANHVAPHLGSTRVEEVTAEAVEAVLARVGEAGLSRTTVRHCWVVLSLLCRWAVAEGLVELAVTEAVPMPKAAPVSVRVMTPDEFLRVREQLPTPGARLLAELLVRSGLRLGEAFALTVEDVDGEALLVSRCLSEPGRRFSSDGSRFTIRSSTKTGVARRVHVGGAVARRLETWAVLHGLSARDFLFPARLVVPPPTGRSFPAKIYTEPLTPERLAVLGTFVGPNGRTYQHGSVNGYTTGRCREACCRQAVSEYSAMRRTARRAARGAGRRAPSVPPAPAGGGRSDDVRGVLEPQVWARLWSSAAKAADLGFAPHARHTRHAHASWLNSGGIGVQAIAERLGHRDERSTQGYVRPVGPEPDAVGLLDGLLDGLLESDGGPEAQARIDAL